MTRRGAVAVVYLAGLAQGLALVTFPAISSVLLSPTGYALSTTAYGALFLPQAITAVSGALLGAGLVGRFGLRSIFVAGLLADASSMVLLLISQLWMGEGAGYVTLLIATASLGLGFGLAVPALNLYAAAFFPDRVDRAVLIMNALLGLGTVLAPALSALFLGLDAWWALPTIGAAILIALVLAALRLPSMAGTGPTPAPAAGRKAGGRRPIPPRFWVYAGFALLYGIVETVNGNWSTVYMASIGASAATATLALTAFWGMVTLGRVVFAAIERRFPPQRTYRLLPFVAAVALFATALLPDGATTPGIIAFGLAGLGCSALLPLTISFGEKELTVMAASVAGGLIGLYQIGYGIAALGVGPLESITGLALAAVFALAGVVALAMGGLSSVVVRGDPAAMTKAAAT
jgi:MFS family permease